MYSWRKVAIPSRFVTRFVCAAGLLLSSLAGGCTTGLAPCPATPVQAPAPAKTASSSLPIRLAVTFDDLPGGFDATAVWPKSRVMESLIATLKKHRVPQPVGFANAIYAESNPDAERGLQLWLDAGFEIASHTYGHISANDGDAAAFLADEAHNRDWLLARIAPHQTKLRFFRYPYLERGRDRNQRIVIARELAARGYRIADVSVDFADWAFAGAYARCIERDDKRALTALSSAYLQNADAALWWSAETAQRVFGRPITHVLLLHAIASTAINLDAMLTAFERAGVQLISLDEALNDAVYQEHAQGDHGDTSTVWEGAHRAGMKIHDYVPRDIELLDQLCL